MLHDLLPQPLLPNAIAAQRTCAPIPCHCPAPFPATKPPLPSPPTQDTEWLVRQAGGTAPITMQSFIKLVDKVGPPPAAVEAPAAVPPPAADAAGTSASETYVPTWQESGFADEPQSPFKVGVWRGLWGPGVWRSWLCWLLYCRHHAGAMAHA